MKTKINSKWYRKLAALTFYVTMIVGSFMFVLIANFAGNMDLNKASVTASKAWSTAKTSFVDRDSFRVKADAAKHTGKIMSKDAFMKAFEGEKIYALATGDSVIYGTELREVFFTTEVVYDVKATSYFRETSVIGGNWVVIRGNPTGFFANCFFSAIKACTVAAFVTVLFFFVGLFLPDDLLEQKRMIEDEEETPSQALPA